MNHVTSALIAFLTATAISAAVAIGCAGQKPPSVPSLTVLECRAVAILPYVGSNAPELVHAAARGSFEPLLRKLLELGLSPDELMRVLDNWHACEPAEADTSG